MRRHRGHARAAPAGWHETMTLLLVLVATALAVIVFVCLLKAALRAHGLLDSTADTAPSGRARLDGNRFIIPIDLPQGRTSIRLFFDREGGRDGCPRFVHDAGPVRVVHSDETGVLLHLYGRMSRSACLAFVYVVDRSTGTPALLRVPPTLKRAREAVAWTFGIDEREWVPSLET
jgi:hypothetical protein